MGSVDNHDLDSEFDFEFKKCDSALRSAVNKNKKSVEKAIKEMFNDFFQAQKK